MARSGVSAVVVNYNTGATLSECVTGLLALVDIEHVWLVDNASADGSAGFLKAKEGDPRVHLLENRENRGFAAACNQGAAKAESEYLLFINPDCRITQDALTALLACLAARSDAGMVGPLILNPDGSEQRGCRRYLPNPRRALIRVLGLGGPGADGQVAGFDLTGTPLPPGATEVEAISGACMLVRRRLFEQLGGWDEGYFLHCEDLDLCMRFSQAGGKVMFVPGAVVSHTQGVSSRGRQVFVLWHKHRGMWRYFSKFQRGASPHWLTVLVWCGIWSRFLLLLPAAALAAFSPRRSA